MAMTFKEIKNLGWGHIKLSKAGLAGAVQSYASDNNSTVAVGFNLTSAFVIRDDDGLFEEKDIIGLIDDKDFNLGDLFTIEGASVLATVDDNGVEVDDAMLKELGICDFSVKESITARLNAFHAINEETVVKIDA